MLGLFNTTTRLHHKGSGFLAAPVCSSFVVVNLSLNFGKVCFCLGLQIQITLLGIHWFKSPFWGSIDGEVYVFIYSKKLSNTPLKQVEKKRATLCNLLRFPGWCFYVWPKDGYRLFESELVYSHPHTASCFASLAPWPRNRGTSERTHLNPSGQTRHKSVRDGNWICGRTLVLLYIAAALQTWWLLEQPVNSFMEHLPAFKMFHAPSDHIPTLDLHARLWWPHTEADMVCTQETWFHLWEAFHGIFFGFRRYIKNIHTYHEGRVTCKCPWFPVNWFLIKSKL